MWKIQHIWGNDCSKCHSYDDPWLHLHINLQLPAPLNLHQDDWCLDDCEPVLSCSSHLIVCWLFSVEKFKSNVCQFSENNLDVLLASFLLSLHCKLLDTRAKNSTHYLKLYINCTAWILIIQSSFKWSYISPAIRFAFNLQFSTLCPSQPTSRWLGGFLVFLSFIKIELEKFEK